MQGSSQTPGKLAGQADNQFMAREIEPERHAGGGIVFAVFGSCKNITGMKVGFFIPGIGRSG